MSGAARLLERLSDGRWHSHASLYRDLGVMVHSRTSNLRKKGHVIDVRCEWDAEQNKNVYWYRLGELSAAEVALGSVTPAALSTSRSGSEPRLVVGTTDAGAIDSARSESEGDVWASPSSGPEQLTLAVA